MELQSAVTGDGLHQWRYFAAGEDHLLTLLEDLECWEEDGSQTVAMTAGRRKTAVPALSTVLDLLTAIVFLLAAGVLLVIVCGWVFVTWLSLPYCRRESRRSTPAEHKQGDQADARKAA